GRYQSFAPAADTHRLSRLGAAARLHDGTVASERTAREVTMDSSHKPPHNPAHVGPYLCGLGQPLLLIAGPCVIESEDLTLHIARRLREIVADLPLHLMFKASFDKANRTSSSSFRGLGME